AGCSVSDNKVQRLVDRKGVLKLWFLSSTCDKERFQEGLLVLFLWKEQKTSDYKNQEHYLSRSSAQPDILLTAFYPSMSSWSMPDRPRSSPYMQPVTAITLCFCHFLKFLELSVASTSSSFKVIPPMMQLIFAVPAKPSSLPSIARSHSRQGIGARFSVIKSRGSFVVYSGFFVEEYNHKKSQGFVRNEDQVSGSGADKYHSADVIMAAVTRKTLKGRKQLGEYQAAWKIEIDNVLDSCNQRELSLRWNHRKIMHLRWNLKEMSIM
nr:hypothetical protein [Tanacetum cinerariifolium]